MLRRSFFRQVARVRLLGFRLRLELLNLLALILDLLLLLLHLRLGLLVGGFLILHRIANCKASTTAHNTADRGTRQRMAYRGAYDCPGTGAQGGAAESAFFTSRERLPRAPREHERSRQRQTHDCR